ncbi:hypothetical protein DM02DRAFT_4209 [Periconia macrospinosa]|uniref:Uncharacterized protein n=1 Tax=Periconia macrospinosa TaxID=97972 RepID=A0A2V1ECZ6_9PLEO|nr:hypothetical protein DM02DRAFT_4209 [Periconia macrospinosa]
MMMTTPFVLPLRPGFAKLAPFFPFISFSLPFRGVCDHCPSLYVLSVNPPTFTSLGSVSRRTAEHPFASLAGALVRRSDISIHGFCRHSLKREKSALPKKNLRGETNTISQPRRSTHPQPAPHCGAEQGKARQGRVGGDALELHQHEHSKQLFQSINQQK